MVHTRGQGARPEGFSEYQPPKREQKVAPRAPMAPLIGSHSSSSSSLFLAVDLSALTGAATIRASAQTRTLCRDASTQTDAELTCKCHLEPASAKRRREPDDGAAQAASKRHKAITPEQPKFLFSKTRNRSLLTSAPSKLSSRHESPFFHRTLEPTSPESSPANTEERPISQERPRPQQPGTPAPAAAQSGIMGSVRKLFGYFTGSSTQGPAENVGQHQQPPSPPQQSSLIDQDQTQDGDTTARESQEFSEQGSPTPAPRITINEPDSPTRGSPLLDSRILTREYLKRRRTANTIGGREQLAAMADSTESRAADFNPAETPGTNKRKLTSVEGQIPGPKRGGFGIDDSYLDVENEVEGIGESSLTKTQPATPATKLLPQTPLRSAMRQTGTDFGTVGRSVKSVRINPIDSVKAVYGQYGRSGDYRGSTFADLESQSPDSSSSLPFDVQHIHLRTTIQNTRNTFRLDPNIIDPNDDTWRPSLANPRPGHFRVPDSDEFEEEEEEDTLTLHQAAAQEEVPPQPSTPRMSHAELPPTTQFELSGFTGHTDSIMVNETQEFRLNKARSDAQKYKPAKSSRLFMSEKARSRSSSPPGSETELTESQIETSAIGGQFQETPVQASRRLTVSRLMGREELDNTVIGRDGMTDYQREHQFDAWVENLLNGGNAPSPQTYVEAGIASSYVESLLQKTWTERDTRESIEFWDREFEEGLRAARQATAQGRQLLWVTDPEEILDFERNGY
ncbi:uncharacterized protein Z519_01212 [Cladophialophora bantiana CBS 173.52]|uniref:Uncharacterized protein n=1 Tax=Cladophialophora bantiana (strain ATCC 10958 / CBS 173.52 / CDC B-1940 / NIH 8579) TaxID=1442370 RepID=A0A0D2HW98_CLAB1|nr:uncharacterized protein Z519_01212 [Cladophialophora bantiana CBS 173.52]KIW97628.1 hypothetical protein Z519_01212 [Cladophialophora bantiana CBS 173.52]